MHIYHERITPPAIVQPAEVASSKAQENAQEALPALTCNEFVARPGRLSVKIDASSFTRAEKFQLLLKQVPQSVLDELRNYMVYIDVAAIDPNTNQPSGERVIKEFHVIDINAVNLTFSRRWNGDITFSVGISRLQAGDTILGFVNFSCAAATGSGGVLMAENPTYETAEAPLRNGTATALAGRAPYTSTNEKAVESARMTSHTGGWRDPINQT